MGVKIHTVEKGSESHINMMIYGRPGAGKTTLIGSAQECEFTTPLLMVDVQGGMLSLAGTGVKIVRPTSFAEVQDIYDYLRYDNKKYQSVGVDSTTETQRKLSMDEITGFLSGEDDGYNNLSDHVPPDRYDWLSSGDQMRRFFRAFQDLAYLSDRSRRIHVFFTALERTDDKLSQVCPSLPGQLGSDVGGMVDILARLTVQRKEKSKVRVLYLREVEDAVGITYLGKARIPKGVKFPTRFINPTMSDILSHWMKMQGG